MLYIGSSKMDTVIEKFDGATYDGVTFKLVKKERMQAMFECTADDDTAKAVAKNILKTDPAFTGMYTRCSIVGRMY